MISRLAVTVTGVVVYLACTLVVPLLDSVAAHEVASTFFNPRVSITSVFALGFAPFVTGFLIVEVFSLITPPGRRLRRGGVDGRRMLNRGALGVSAIIVVVQSYGIASFLTTTSAPSGAALTSAPALLVCLTLTAGTFAVAGLAELLSRYGLTNGFAVLFVAGSTPYVIHSLRLLLGRGMDIEPETRIACLIWAALLVAALVLFLLRRPEIHLVSSEGQTLPYRLPPLPQGYLPIIWAAVLTDALSREWFGTGPLLPWLAPEPRTAVVAVVILALSLLGAWMFTARPRVEANLAGLASVPSVAFGRSWWHQLAFGALVIAAGDAGLTVLRDRLAGFESVVLPMASMILLIAFVLDAVDTARLASKAPLEWVLTLDNVHLAEFLRARLDAEGIECVVTSFRFRRMFYFLGPLFKMSLLVPAADRERAARLVEETPFEIV